MVIALFRLITGLIDNGLMDNVFNSMLYTTIEKAFLCMQYPFQHTETSAMLSINWRVFHPDSYPDQIEHKVFFFVFLAAQWENLLRHNRLNLTLVKKLSINPLSIQTIAEGRLTPTLSWRRGGASGFKLLNFDLNYLPLIHCQLFFTLLFLNRSCDYFFGSFLPCPDERSGTRGKKQKRTIQFCYSKNKRKYN